MTKAAFLVGKAVSSTRLGVLLCLCHSPHGSIRHGPADCLWQVLGRGCEFPRLATPSGIRHVSPTTHIPPTSAGRFRAWAQEAGDGL